MSVILVTGGNQGLGYTLIKELATHFKSYKIILTSRNIDNGKQALAKLHGDGLNNVSFVQLDVTDDNSIENAYTEVQKGYGKIDYLVLNAAIQNVNSVSLREVYSRIYDTNVVSNVLLLKKFKPLIYKSAKPRVLFISSGLGSVELHIKKTFGPLPLDVILPYSATKPALNVTMASFKNEWPEVKFCAIDPGYCATNLNHFSGPKTPLQGVKAAFAAIAEDDTWKNGQFLQFEAHQKSLTVVPW